jgi:prolyl-tRNA editing enzyme YbaK/EbsC (Cys-tRNA(Pro) deacylase)
MSLETVRAWLAGNAPDLPLIEVEESTATVETAAKALGVEPGRIAKTLAVRAELILALAVVETRIATRAQQKEVISGARPRMLGAEETFELTGHPVGGVCPFGLENPLPVYLDASLRTFEVVYPAGGSLNTSVEVSTERLFELVAERWVDLCRLPEEAAGIQIVRADVGDRPGFTYDE